MKMKKLLISALCLLSFSATKAQQQSDKTTTDFQRFELHGGVESNHLWRGLVISDMPTVTSMLSFYFDEAKHWRAGFWGGAAISRDADDTHYKEIDYFLEYGSPHFTIGLWDLFNTRNVLKPQIFNYKNKETTHLLDLRTSYYLGDNFPMRLQANVLLYGTGDQQLSNNNVDKDQKYSTYVEAAYPVYTSPNIGVNAFVGAGFSLNGDTHLYGNGKNNFDVVNVGLTANKDLTLGNVKIPLHGTFMWNPSTDYARMQVAVDLF